MLNDRRLVLTLLLTVTLVCASVSVAKKPVKPPPEPPPPTPEGTIYFKYGSEIMGMDGDGNMFFDHPAPSSLGYSAYGAEPSSLDYGGYRWWLAILWDDTIPVGETSGAYEVYAYRPVTLPDDTVDLEWVQLTAVSNETDAWPFGIDLTGGIARWSNDGRDSYITFSGLDDAAKQRYIFRLNVSGLELEDHVKEGPELLPATRQELDVILATPNAIRGYALSPDGNSVVYWASTGFAEPEIASETRVANVETGVEITIWDEAGMGLDWSPNGDKIAFRGRDEIRTINPDGTEHAIVAELGRHVEGWEAYSAPFWSPDSSQLMFRELELGKKGATYYQIHRMAAEGGTIVNLTGDLDKTISKLPLGWRLNTAAYPQ